MSLPQHVVAVRHRGQDIRLAAWFRDSGPDLILFLHGLGCSKQNWRHAWSAPALYGHSLLAIDLPGFGASPRPPAFGYALEDHAAVLAGVIDAHASRRLCLVAHSMGGSVAMLLSPAAARRVDALVLVEGRLVRSSCGIAAAAAAVGPEQFDAETFPQFRNKVAADRRAAFDLDRADQRAFYLSSKSLIKWASGNGLLSRLAGFECPTAFVYGADNRHLTELALLDPGILHEVADAGHFVMNDNPAEFYPLLARLST